MYFFQTALTGVPDDRRGISHESAFLYFIRWMGARKGIINSCLAILLDTVVRLKNM